MSAKKHYRKLTVDGKVYNYRVGALFVDIRPVSQPSSTRTVVSIAKVKGITEAEVERGRWKRWLSVTPRDITDHIRRITR